MNDHLTTGASDSGSIMIVLTVLLMPLAIISGVFLTTMTARSDRLAAEIHDERAFLAAESGLDEAIYRAKVGTLTSGTNFTRTLSNGLGFTVAPIHLGSDGADNDGDTFVDEDDEDIFQVIIRGTYRSDNRRLAAYLAPTNNLPTLEASVTVFNPNVTIDFSGTPEISGHDTNIDGTPGDPALDTYGLSIMNPPGVVADLDTELTGGERTAVTGLGPNPSLTETAGAIDLAAIVAEVQNSASIVLTNPHYDDFTFGTPLSPAITYRNGNVRFSGTSSGAGILVVDGNLDLKGDFFFYGLVIVLGNLDNSAGTATIYGGVIQGPTGNKLDLRGTSEINFSAEALAIAGDLTNRYVAFNGWQELSRN